jgi:GT2 family glycosyltransferase
MRDFRTDRMVETWDGAKQALPITAIVVSFETRDELEPCLESLVAAPPAEIIVVDNGSTDGSIELVRERFPEVTLIVCERNIGYGGAANVAVAASSTPAVLVLNSDTVVPPGAFQALGRYLADHPEAGLVGPRLLETDGSLQLSAWPWPSIGDMLLTDTGLHYVVRRIPGLRRLFIRTWDHDRTRPVPWVAGAAMAIRRTAFEAVGGFDEAFFMYSEDVDLCRRLAKAGFETHYATVTTVMHKGEASTSKHWLSMHREFFVAFRRYVLTHEPRQAAAILRLSRLFFVARRWRDRAWMRLAREPQRRAQLRARLFAVERLLGDSMLWRT